MEKRRSKTGLLALIVVSFCSTFLPKLRAREGSTGDGCKKYVGVNVPKFRKGRTSRVSGGSGALVMYVAIAPGDFDENKILSLVCSIAREHANEEALFVYVFDTYRAAMHFNPAGEGNTREANRSFRARYGFFRDKKGGQGLTWRPDAKDYNRWDHIDLGEPPERRSQ
jgi:hypothetical protein